MRFVDVNVLVYAHRPESPGHDRYLVWLDAARRADEPLGIPTLSLSGFLWVVTHPKVFRDPTPLPQALEFADVLRGAPNYADVRPGSRLRSVRGAPVATPIRRCDAGRGRFAAFNVGRDLTPLAVWHVVFAPVSELAWRARTRIRARRRVRPASGPRG